MNNKINTIYRLLQDFTTYIDSRKLVSLVMYGKTFEGILDLHYYAWKKKTLLIAQNSEEHEWIEYDQIVDVLDGIIANIHKRSIAGREARLMFKKLAEHFSACQSDESIVKGDRYDYVEHVLYVNNINIFDIIETSEYKKIIFRSYIPQEWRVTSANLTDTENIVLMVVTNTLLKWIENRISKEKSEYDHYLDDTIEYMFPSVDPIIWSKMLIIFLSRYDPSEMENIIMRDWKFGLIGRSKFYWTDVDDGVDKARAIMDKKMKKDRDKEERETYQLAKILFERYFNLEILNSYIESLNELEKYKKEEIELRNYIIQFKIIINKMIELI